MNYPPQGPPPGGMPPGGMPPGGVPPAGGQHPGGGYFPPGSNQPYPPPPGQHHQQYQQPNKRSSIPMVIGILMLVFGGLGVLITVVKLAGSGDPSPFMGMDSDFNDKWDTYRSWERISYLVGLVIGLLHVIGGIQCVRYAGSGPKWAMAYGWIAIAWQVLSVILVYAWLSPLMSEVPGMRAILGFVMVFAAIFGVAWPIIVLALMSRPGAKQACAASIH